MSDENTTLPWVFLILILLFAVLQCWAAWLIRQGAKREALIVLAVGMLALASACVVRAAVTRNRLWILVGALVVSFICGAAIIQVFMLVPSF